MLDQFLYGSVDRISPEAPVPVFRLGTEKQMLGGIGNVVNNLRALGCKTSLIGIIGTDSYGKTIERFLDEINCSSFLMKTDLFETIVKTRMIANNNHLLRTDKEVAFSMTYEIKEQILSKLKEIIEQQDIVLISDYNKGFFDYYLTTRIIEICNKNHKPVLVDPKGSDYSKYKGATVVKPNLKELMFATKTSINPKSENFIPDVKAAMKILIKENHIETVITTLSEHGMVLVSKNKEQRSIHIPTEAKEVFDVSGAGDTCLACLGAAIGAKFSLEEAVNIANIGAGIVVAKLGTATVSQGELAVDIKNKESLAPKLSATNKIVTLEEALQIIEDQKSRGKKIGFTNGCFDMLHLGHLSSFMSAKKECDFLVVGINADASVQKLKGPNRPVNDELTRSTLLASLEYINLVIVFNEDTALPLIEALRPDMIAKEGYEIPDWPEAQAVLAYGGQVVKLPRVGNYSTSNLIKRLQG